MAQSHESAPSGSERPARLTDFIKTHRAEIVAVWAEAVSALPIARELERPLLVDHIPDLLDRICEIANHVGAGREAESPLDLAELHAAERLEEGFDLGQVVTEYRMLRACILRIWARYVVAAEQLRDLQALDEAIDISIGASIDRYTRARDRTLRALDRIATEAFGSRSLDELLRRLLRVMQETTSAVDTAAILLREGDVLRVRAAVGLGREAEENMTMKVGEGFAGAVAASGCPQTFNGHAPTIKSPLLRSAGLHTLYGVPLVEDSEVIGVAHMGSRTAHEFSMQDKRLFAALTARATSAIKQHMLHEEAVRASQDNARLYREAQDATKLRENVLAIVSHELRTPLNTIDLAATMLLHGALEAGSRKSVETIRRSTERMEKMIGDLLDMATIQSGRLTIEPAEVVMRELVNEVIDLYEPLALEKGIKITRDIEATNARLFCDRDRIQQVFGNLIGNAKKFCRSGDVILVRAKLEGEHATFSVQDSGPGISPEDLPRIFDPYWSGERGRNKGTGLGLFISKAIVEAHGGALSVVSKPGAGTTFSFTLAALAPARHAPEAIRL